MRTVVNGAIGRSGGCKLERAPALTLSACTALVIAACSGGGMPAAQTSSSPPPPAMTTVTMVISSTANDQLSAFDLVVQGVSLTSAAGKKVSVLTQARNSEFIHVNGTNEPLLTARVPQDLYTAAMVPGQAVYISSPAFAHTGSYNAAANTVTLVPQAVNGTVTGVTTSGDFTVYSVSLAAYDLFSSLSRQAGQTTLVTNPSSIEVYTDTSTAMLTSSAPAPGDTLRFYGLVFNHHGTLRMDCAQVSAGVTALSQ